MSSRKNKLRGFRGLRVWQDAKDIYLLSWKLIRKLPPELRRVAANHINSVDSVHRNIAEGYCRRSIKEYLLHLNYSSGSLGEAISGLHVYFEAGHFSKEEFETWDVLSYRLENGLIKLIEGLEIKRDSGDWSDSFMVKESNVIYIRGYEENSK